MIWAAIAANGKTYLALIEKTVYSKHYITVLEQVFLPFSYFNYGKCQNDFVFMQDNASVHISNHSKEWFKHFYMDVLKWPALFADLTSI